jgi:heptosyltransferase-2
LKSPSESQPQAKAQAPGRILIIQTAFLGDVVLATGLLETLHHSQPEAKISLLVRQGNEALFEDHPFLEEVLVWNKKKGKWRGWWQCVRAIRRRRFDWVINLQRFGASGLMTVLSRARFTSGFDKNPWSRFFDRKVVHRISRKDERPVWHETDRNHLLIAELCGPAKKGPRLYPRPGDYQAVETYRRSPYLCVAPASVWFTKQYPESKWAEFLRRVPEGYRILLIGGPGDRALCERLASEVPEKSPVNLAGSLGLLQTAALMEGAYMNYTNDSGPLHLATAMRAPLRAIFCSTVRAFGFGPIWNSAQLIETQLRLRCRPCGLHGKSKCPLGHFRCAYSIRTEQLLEPLVRADAQGPPRSIPRRGMR